MSESGERHWTVLREADDVTPEIERDVIDCVDWFDDEPSMPTEEFIDRLCKTYGGSGYGPGDFDVEDLASPAVKKIMRIARAERKARQQ